MVLVTAIARANARAGAFVSRVRSYLNVEFLAVVSQAVRLPPPPSPPSLSSSSRRSDRSQRYSAVGRLRHASRNRCETLRAVINAAIGNYPLINYSRRPYAIFDERDSRGSKGGREKKREPVELVFSQSPIADLTVIRYRCCAHINTRRLTSGFAQNKFLRGDGSQSDQKVRSLVVPS